MIYEEFKQLALNPPKISRLSVYWLEVVTVSDLPERRKNYYPSFEVERNTLYVCQTIQKAESLIKKEVKEKGENIYCFYLHRLPFGINIKWNWGCVEWVYDAQGVLIEQSRCSKLNEDYRKPAGRYLGRSADMIRFQSGDIVEVLDGNKVSLAVVVRTPPSISWCWEYYNRCSESYGESSIHKDQSSEEFLGYILDFSDDSYIVIDAPSYYYHSHSSSHNVFKPRFALPKRIRMRLESYYESILKEEEVFLKQKIK